MRGRDKNGKGQGLAMLRLEAHRYKREMQQIRMQSELHVQRKSAQSLQSETPKSSVSIAPSGNGTQCWRLPEIITTSQATNSNWREVGIPPPARPANVEEETQTDDSLKQEVETKTEGVQIEGEETQSLRESTKVPTASEVASKPRTCSKHCGELKSKIDAVSDADVCECHANSGVRVNASVVFTANPSRAAVEEQVETPTHSTPSLVQPDDQQLVALTTMVAAENLVQTCNDGQRSSAVVPNLEQFQNTPSGLRALVSSHNNVSLQVRAFQSYGEGPRYADGDKGMVPADVFRRQQELSITNTHIPTEPKGNLWNAAPVASILAGHHEAPYEFPPEPSLGCTNMAARYSKAGKAKIDEEDTSLHVTEVIGNKRVRHELTGEGAMAARLATRIKHALEGISGKADARRTILFSELPTRAVHRASRPRARVADHYPELKHFEDSGGMRGLETLNSGGILKGVNSMPKMSHNARDLTASSSEQGIPRMDADMYLKDVMAALSTGQHASSALPENCDSLEESPKSECRNYRDERPGETSRRRIRSCLEQDLRVSYHSGKKKDPVKEDAAHLGSENVKGEKQRLQMLSTVQKLRNAAETAKRLYSDLVVYTHEELNTSTDHVDRVRHLRNEKQVENRVEDISEFARPFHEIGVSCVKKEEGLASTGHGDIADQNVFKAGQICTQNVVKEHCHGCPSRFSVEREAPANIVHPAGLPCEKHLHCGTSETEQPPEEAEPEPLDEITIEFPHNLDGHTDIMVSRNNSIERPGYNVEITTPFESPRQKQPEEFYQVDGVVRQGSASWRTGSTMSKRRIGPAGTGSHYRPRAKSKSPPKARTDGVQYCLHTGRRHLSPSKSHGNIRPDWNNCVELDNKDPPGETPCIVRSNEGRDPTPRRFHDETPCIVHNSEGRDPTPRRIQLKTPCVVHSLEGTEPTPRRIQDDVASERFHDVTRERFHDVARAKFQDVSRDHRKNLFNEIPGHGLFQDGRDHKSPGRNCAGKFSKNYFDEIPELGLLSERDHRSSRRMHDDMACSSSGRRDNETARRLYDEIGPDGPLSGRRDFYSEAIQSALPATEVISKEPSHSARGTRHSSVREVTGNVSARPEANTHTMSDHVDRAAAAAGLAKEIEGMIADVVTKPKSYLRNRESKYMPRHRPLPLPGEQSEPYRQTKLDRAVVAAAQAVNKLKTVSLVSQDEGFEKATPRKGRTPSTKILHEDTVGGGFYDQMHQELKELAAERMKLVRQERARFQSQFLLSPRLVQKSTHLLLAVMVFRCHLQYNQDTELPIKGRRDSDLRNLSDVDCCEKESSKFGRTMGKSQKFPSISDAFDGFHTPGSKRQRSATSPAREHGNKLLRLSAGKAEAQPGKSKQGHNLVASSSVKEAAGDKVHEPGRLRPGNLNPQKSELARRKGKSVYKDDGEKSVNGSSTHYSVSSFHRMASSSFGRWKPPPERSTGNGKAQKEISSKRKFRTPAWVDRMSQARDIFSRLLQPLMMPKAREEHHLKASVRRRNLRPPGSMFRSSLLAKQISEHMTGARAFTKMHLTSDTLHGKGSTASIEYDSVTGRRIYPRQDPEVKFERKAERRTLKENSSFFYEKNSVPIRRLIVKHDRVPRAAANSGGNTIRPKGWNADPWVVSDTPHKASDIVRYNRNGARKVQVRKHGAGNELKTMTEKPEGQINLRHVTFAAMEVQSKDRFGKSRKGVTASKSGGQNQSHAAHQHGSLLQPKRVKRVRGTGRNGVGFKRLPVRNEVEVHKIEGDEDGHWAYREEFWTKNFKSELENVTHNESLYSLVTSRRTSQPGSPNLQMITAHSSWENLHNEVVGRVQEEDQLTGEAEIQVECVHDQDKPEFESKESAKVENGDAAANIELVLNAEGENKGLDEGDENPYDPSPLRCQAASVASGHEGDALIEHITTEVTVDLVHLLCSGEDAEPQNESFSQKESKILSTAYVQHSKIAGDNHQDDLEVVQEESANFPQSPLLPLDDTFPTNMGHEDYLSTFECLQDSTVQIQTQLEGPGSSSLSITRQTFIDSIAQENVARQLEDIELERTLMDIVLHTILRDDPLQDLQAPPSSLESSSVPPNTWVTDLIPQADKEVEVRISSEETQSHLPPVAPCVDNATEPDNFPLSPKDQECQTMEPELPAESPQRPISQTQDICSTEIQYMQQQQATQVHWNCVGVQTPDLGATGSTASLGPPAALPMLVPVYFPHGPTVVPSVHFATPIHTTIPPMELSVYPPSVTTANRSTQAGVNQRTQAVEPHSPPSRHANVSKILSRAPELPRHGRTGQGHVDPWEGESESDWDELKRYSSPKTPTTPLSSPGHKAKLKKAMEPYPPFLCNVQATSAVDEDAQVTTSEVCHQVINDGQQAEQIFEREWRPLLRVSKMDEIDDNRSRAEEPLHLQQNQTSHGGVTRRGTSWARVKEMEEAALSLLRTVLRRTPPATSSSEYSCDTPPGLQIDMSPGQVDFEVAGVGGSRSSGEIASAVAERFGRRTSVSRIQAHAFGPFDDKRASLGEITYPLHLGPLSEGEAEAGAVPSIDEVGQIWNGTPAYTFGSNSRTDTEGRGSEPGELCGEADLMSATRQSSS